METHINNYFKIYNIDPFSLKKTLECGQCFRFEKISDNNYIGVVKKRICHIFSKNNIIYIYGNKYDYIKIWKKYFDFDRNYKKIENDFVKDDISKNIVKFSTGIRILSQEPWEVLCSFLISQCNNIPRIKKIIYLLCQAYGEKIIFNNRIFYTFPSFEVIAKLTLEQLNIIKCGYRSKYILKAANDLLNGNINFNHIYKIEDNNLLRKHIMTIYGVGAKVCDCFLLYGMSKYDMFPVDTWMKKTKKFYTNYVTPYEKNSGIYQQYIYYYVKNNIKKINNMDN